VRGRTIAWRESEVAVPFRAETQVGVAMKHVNEPLPDVLVERPEVSAALRALADKPLGLENLGLARRNGLAVRDNLIQHDRDLTIREVQAFRDAGGGTIVVFTSAALTPRHCGRSGG